MKQKMLVALFGVALLLIFGLEACKKDTNSEQVSLHGESESHNQGLNCLECHKSGGEGEGIFSVGGTVYDSLLTTPQIGGYVELYDALSGGNLVLRLEVDDLGNFYTCEKVNFSQGLYPRVVNANGDVKEMGSVVTTGACYSCHGNTTNRIWEK